MVTSLKLPLERRPIVESIEITYRDEVLPYGKLEAGGLWYYDESSNTINFYHTDFVKDFETDELRIAFDVDDGVDRNF